MWWYPDRRVIRAVTRAAVLGNFPIGAPVRMIVVLQPPGSAVTGQALSQAPIVAFMDAYGNIVPNVGASVTAAPSSGTMSGTTTVVVDGTGYATFSNLIFDDIANTIISTRTITFSCAGFSALISTSVVVTDSTIKLWLEADYGVVDANGAALTTWSDRSPSGGHMTPGAGMTAPVYRSSGLGGISNLPYWEFNNAHGMSTALLAALALADFSVFMVGLREVADSNGNWYEVFSTTPAGAPITQGLRPNGPSIYAARQPVITLLESSRNSGASWLTTNVRKLFRHDCDGTNAGHLLYDSGVVVGFASNALFANPGVSAPLTSSFHVGFRDSGTPTLNLRGKISVLIAASPKPSALKAASVESYLTTKWLGGAQTNPVASRGPILLASSVIDGVTVDVLGWQSSATPDFKSSDNQYGKLIFRFSEPIKRFRATLVTGQQAPIAWYRSIIGVNNYTSPSSWDYVTGGGYAPNVNNQTVQINDTVTGFTTVITQLAPISGSGFVPTSVFKDCYFSKMGDA